MAASSLLPAPCFYKTLWSESTTRYPAIVIAAALFVVGLLAILQGKKRR